MSSKLQRIQQQAAQVAEVGLDMSQTSKGGGGRRLLPAGNALGRFVLYREFGKHAREYQGTAKAAALEVRLGFLLWGKGDPNGPDTPENLYHRIDGDKVIPGFIESFGMALGNNEKSKTKIAFDKMNYKGTAKKFIELLDETYIVPIKVVKPQKADGKPRNEVDWATIAPARDPISGAPYNVPAASDDDYKVFLWDAPTKEDWDEMFIDGTNDAGKSKNFLQARCIEAVDFQGSLLQQLLGGALPDLGLGVESDEPEGEEPAAQEAVPTAVPAVPGVPTQAAVPGVPSVPQAQAAPADVPFVGGTVPSVPTVPTIPSVPSVG